MTWPHDLREYIEEKWKETAGYNHSNHAPTSQEQLDSIAQDAEREYALGLKIISAIPKDDLARCRKLFEHKKMGSLSADELFPCSFPGGGQYLVPSYVTLIEEVRKLKEVLA